jgi:MoaC family
MGDYIYNRHIYNKICCTVDPCHSNAGELNSVYLSTRSTCIRSPTSKEGRPDIPGLSNRLYSQNAGSDSRQRLLLRFTHYCRYCFLLGIYILRPNLPSSGTKELTLMRAVSNSSRRLTTGKRALSFLCLQGTAQSRQRATAFVPDPSLLSLAPRHSALSFDGNSHVYRTSLLSSIRLVSGSSGNDNHNDHTTTTSDPHAFFRQQMMELQNEQESLMTVSDTTENSPSPTTSSQYVTPASISENTLQKDSSNSSNDESIFEAQMADLKAERESLFGFTDQDRQAWSHAGSRHHHSDTFMQEVEAARQAQLAMEIAQDTASLDDFTTGTTSSSTESMASPFSHLSQDATHVHMVDVGNKVATRRTAIAQSTVILPSAVVEALQPNSKPANGGKPSLVQEVVGPKGPIFETARIAGIMAAK